MHVVKRLIYPGFGRGNLWEVRELLAAGAKVEASHEVRDPTVPTHTCYILHPTSYTLHPTPHTLHPTPHTSVESSLGVWSRAQVSRLTRVPTLACAKVEASHEVRHPA